MAPVTFAVVGDVRGAFGKLRKRVAALKKKNIKAVFCVGRFFGEHVDEEDLHCNNATEEPYALPTYFVLGEEQVSHAAVQRVLGRALLKDSLEQDREVCKNLHFLGRCGSRRIAGLSVAFLSGVFRADTPKETQDALPGITAEMVAGLQDDEAAKSEAVKSALFHSFEGINWPALHQSGPDVDILLTSEWPRRWASLLSELPPGIDERTRHRGSAVGAQLCRRLCPRYHFVGQFALHAFVPADAPENDVTQQQAPLETHTFESAPWRWNKRAHTGRLVSLAPVGNKSKAKWMMALALTPLSEMSPDEVNSSVPADATPCPFDAKRTVPARQNNVHPQEKRRRLVRHEATPAEGNTGYNRFDVDAAVVEQRERDRERGVSMAQERKQHLSVYSQRRECWFCLASPSFETHMVVALGDKAYVAVPKGPLLTGHCLIMPMLHAPASALAPADTQDEMRKFMDALREMFASEAGGKRQCIFYERHIPTRNQAHGFIECVPLPSGVSLKSARDALMRASDERGVPLVAPPAQPEEAPAGVDASWHAFVGDSPYLWFDLSDADADMLVYRIPPHQRVQVQIMRELLCRDVLKRPDRILWQNCQQTKEEEAADAEALKRVFASFDFTAESDSDSDSD
ncbi:MAG: hypothetical protein MHM6MM_001368 [Cercozoa sp. M6MM]